GARGSGWGEELGYMGGGSPVVLEGLARDLVARGGTVVRAAEVQGIVLEGGRARGVRAGGETIPADAVVSTVTTSRFRALVPELEGPSVEGLRRIPTVGS